MECHCVPVGSDSHNYRLLSIKILLGYSKRIFGPWLPIEFCSLTLLSTLPPFYPQRVFGYIDRFLTLFSLEVSELVPLLGFEIVLLLIINSFPVAVLILWSH